MSRLVFKIDDIDKMVFPVCLEHGDMQYDEVEDIFCCDKCGLKVGDDELRSIYTYQLKQWFPLLVKTNSFYDGDIEKSIRTTKAWVGLFTDEERRILHESGFMLHGLSNYILYRRIDDPFPTTYIGKYLGNTGIIVPDVHYSGLISAIEGGGLERLRFERTPTTEYFAKCGEMIEEAIEVYNIIKEKRLEYNAD